MIYMKFFLKIYCFATDTNSIEYKHTQSAQCRLIKTGTTERLIGRFEVENRVVDTFLALFFANA